MKYILGLALCLTMSGVYGQSIPAGLEYKVVGSSVTITNYRGNASSVDIPSRINGMLVVSIGNSAFSDCGSLTGVTIPNSVTYIGYLAFEGCESLKNATLSRKTRFGRDVFPKGVAIRYSD